MSNQTSGTPPDLMTNEETHAAILLGVLSSIESEYGVSASLATSDGRKLLAEVLVEKGWRWKDGIIE